MNSAGPASLSPDSCEPRWYAAYTRSNHEKRVAAHLGLKSVQYFLPLYDSVRQWKDRRMRLELPVFPSYVFVHVALRDRFQVLQIPGVSKLVGFNGTPVPLAEKEIEILRKGWGSGVTVEPYPYLAIGRIVRIRSGPFAGVSGILLRRPKSLRVIISIELLKRSMAMDIDWRDLEPAG